MFESLQTIKADRFLTDSLIFSGASFVMGLGNYLFHFLLVRLLNVEDYGQFLALTSLLTILGVPLLALSTTLIKFTAHFKAEGRPDKISSLWTAVWRGAVLASVMAFLLWLWLSPALADFLKLDSTGGLIILSLCFVALLASFVNKGVLEGLEKFKIVSLIGSLEILVKILLASVLVALGLKVNGALLAILLATVLGGLLSFYSLASLRKGETVNLETKEISRYFFFTLFSLLALDLLYNLDVILAKHFLPALVAGQYAALVLIGRIVFFLVSPLSTVMFPSVAREKSGLPAKTLGLTLLVSLAVLAFYFLFPGLTVQLLVGPNFLAIAPLLGWFGLSMFLYSLVNLFGQYFLSLGNNRFVFFLGGAVWLQFLGISFYHANLGQIVLVMNLVMALALSALMIYYVLNRNRRHA